MANPASVPAKELSSINFRSMLGGPLMAVVDAQAQAAMSTVEIIKSVGFKPTSSDPNKVDNAGTGEPIYVEFKYPKEVKPYEPKVEAAILGISVKDNSRGSNYDPNNPPVVHIDAPPTGGTQAKAEAEIVNGAVNSIKMTDYGSGYKTKPGVRIDAAPTGGTNADIELIWQDAKDAQPAEFQEMKLEVPILTMLPIPFIRIEETTIDFNAKINSIEESQTNSMFKVGGSLNVKYGVNAGASIPIEAISIGAKVSGSVNMKVSSSYQKNTSSGYKVDRTYSMSVHIRAVQDEMPAGIERILGMLEDNIKAQPVLPPA